MGEPIPCYCNAGSIKRKWRGKNYECCCKFISLKTQLNLINTVEPVNVDI